MNRTACFTIMFVGALTLVAGCGQRRGTVSGTVTQKGRSLAAGQVSILPPSGVPIMAEIKDNGQFEAKDVPYGDMIVMVMPPAGAGGPTAAEKAIRKKFVEEINPKAKVLEAGPMPTAKVYVPAKYSDPTQTPLRVAVKSSKVSLDIALDD